MKEYIITNTTICPHAEISGKLCSACKIPDVECEKVNWYHYFRENIPCFTKLSLDEQGTLVDFAYDLSKKFYKNDEGFRNLSLTERKRTVTGYFGMEHRYNADF